MGLPGGGCNQAFNYTFFKFFAIPIVEVLYGKKVTEEEPFKEEELPVSQDISFRTSFHFLRGLA